MKWLSIFPMLVLAGCATAPAPGSPKLQVSIPTTCENLAVQVALPKPKPEAEVTAAEQRGAAVQANSNLRSTRSCQQRQRERFARGQ